MQEINSRSYLVSASGGHLDFVSPEGELLASVAVPPGRIPVSDYLDLVPQGASVEVSDGLSVLNPRSGFGRQRMPASLSQSGANPDFKPTAASASELRVRAIVAGLQADNDGVKRRLAAYERIEHVRSSPALIEPITETALPLTEKTEDNGASN